MDELKKHFDEKLKTMQKWCEGAQMCSDYDEGLFNFAHNMRMELSCMAAELHNFEIE